MPIIREKIVPDSVVYTDGYSVYDVLDVSEFHHYRIDHTDAFTEDGHNHINGIENFWSQAAAPEEVQWHSKSELQSLPQGM